MYVDPQNSIYIYKNIHELRPTFLRTEWCLYISGRSCCTPASADQAAPETAFSCSAPGNFPSGQTHTVQSSYDDRKKPFTIYYTHNSEGNSVWYVHKVHPSSVGTSRMFGWVPDHSANSLVELFISGEIIGLEPTPHYIHKTGTESQQFQEQRLWGLMTVIPRGTCQTFKMLYTLSKYENIK